MSDISFNQIKQELETTANQVLKKHLDQKTYSQKEAQTWTNTISDELIKNLSAMQKGFKFMCNCTIFQKGDSSLHFSSTCLWNPNCDGSLTVKFENDQLHCFICLFGILP